MLVITDGQQTTDKGPYTPVKQSSQLLKNKGVLVYSLGIGPGVSTSEQSDIASKPSYVFTAPSFEDLHFRVRQILNAICAEGNY